MKFGKWLYCTVKANSNGLSETKLDESVLDSEVDIDGYKLIRLDRNRFGGGVSCYIKSEVGFNIRNDFSVKIENIFLDILIPNSKPILIGIVYRPPSQSGFLRDLSEAINNTTNFDSLEVYILGDFNLNLIDKKTGSPCELANYKEFFSSHGLKQLISCPTRITKNTSTLLDHVLTNSHDKVSLSGVIDIGLSDHQLIYCTRKVTRAKFHDNKFITIRSLKNYSQDIYIEALNEIDFPDYSEFDSVDEAYDDLVKKITAVIDKIAPVKKIRVKSNTQEWFDDEIRQAIKIRDKCFSKFKKSRQYEDNLKYKKARNNVQALIKKKKINFVNGKLEDNIGKPKELWKTLKSLGLSEKSKASSKICLGKDKNLSFDPKTNAETFMIFFSNLAKNLVSKLPIAPNRFGLDTVKNYYEKFNLEGKDFSFSNVTEGTVSKLLNNINPSKASGLDNLAGKFLKEGSSVLKCPITQICNLSISHSVFPDKCKHAKLKPLFKKGMTTDPKNYRPISLLPLISKIIEKIIHDKTQCYLDENKIIYSFQSGFRSHHSTNSCLSYLSTKVLCGFDKGLLTGMILIDLQKAFDTIDHEILLNKMHYLGFSASAIKWFRSYLANRTFLVNVDESYSNPGDLNCGVPQGSILGPLLFLLYVNDMPQAVSCDLLLYADDSCLVFQAKDVDEIEFKLNQDFNNLCDWFVDNKLSIHFGEDKTKSIIFGNQNKLKNLRNLDIRHGEVKIKQYTKVTYLGCILDNKLSGEYMTTQALGKINGRLKFLYRKQKFLHIVCEGFSVMP